MIPVCGLAILRYPDGSVKIFECDNEPWSEPIPVPETWQEKHALLIDGCAQIKSDHGIVHNGIDPNSKWPE